MTPAQIRIVRASFARIEPVLPELGERFYQRLFTLAPDLRPQFEAETAGQMPRFMTVVRELVKLHLRSLLALPAVGGRAAIPALVELGRDHAAMGLRAGHLDQMRMALADVLRAAFREHFTREVEGAWMAAFDVLAHAMAEGMASEAGAGPDRFLDRLGDQDDDAVATPALQQFFQ
jgi:hemoglobin-like flavoprotein